METSLNQYAAYNYAWLYFNLSNQNFENSISLIKKRTIVSVETGNFMNAITEV